MAVMALRLAGAQRLPVPATTGKAQAKAGTATGSGSALALALALVVAVQCITSTLPARLRVSPARLGGCQCAGGGPGGRRRIL